MHMEPNGQQISFGKLCAWQQGVLWTLLQYIASHYSTPYYYVWQGGVGAAAPAASFQEKIKLVPESPVRNPLRRGFMDTSMQKGFKMPML